MDQVKIAPISLRYNLRAFLFRFERTTAEAKKIAEVKEELQKLDAELAADVTILRKEIEAAALNYAHYRYGRSSFILRSLLKIFRFLFQKKLRSNRNSIFESKIRIAPVIGEEGTANGTFVHNYCAQWRSQSEEIEWFDGESWHFARNRITIIDEQSLLEWNGCRWHWKLIHSTVSSIYIHWAGSKREWVKFCWLFQENSSIPEELAFHSVYRLFIA